MSAGCFLCRLEVLLHPHLPDAYASVALDRVPGPLPTFTASLERRHAAEHPNLFRELRAAIRRAHDLPL